MAYNVTGTAGNDTLNQSGDTGPGTIVGLAGDDTISIGSGAAQVFGNSGNDSVLLRAGNTGTVWGGTENDTVFGPAGTGSMQTFGNAGNDIINFTAVSSAQTIVGGDDSSDGNDSIFSGTGADIIYGNGGDDRIAGGPVAGDGNDTFVGGFGNDVFLDPLGGGNDLVFANQGNDTINTFDGADTAYGGQGNDYIVDGLGVGNALWFGNEGNDTVAGATALTARTVVGGQDSADGADSIFTGIGADFVFGNGGNDTIDAGAGANTVVGGFGGDSILTGDAADLVFANESNDTVDALGGNDTVFGGQGNDLIFSNGIVGRESLQGNEGNDTLVHHFTNIDTLSGGTGNDVFRYDASSEDGNNAAGGGPVEQITDLNWAEDKFDTLGQVTFATNTGAGTGADLNASANNAIAAAFALGGGGGTVAAAQFTFGGRTYLAIDQITLGTFLDTDDLLIDITGATGAIATSNFI